jgi:hypothetical protein
MTNLRTAFLATTAVGLMTLATPAFAGVIMTPRARRRASRRRPLPTAG